MFVDHPLHELMSRTGSFPLRVAHSLIQKYSNGIGIVFDPFSGKGTTLLAARLLGHSAYGMDVAPEAVICSSAKLTNVTLEEVSDYILRIPITRSKKTQIPRPVRVFFHPSTLEQLLAIRDVLIRDLKKKGSIRDNATVAMAALLGILHGHASYSLSVSSAHAYSMSPNYVAGYATRHGLRRPVKDVKDCLIRKLSRCFNADSLPRIYSSVKRGSALDCATLFPELIGKVDVILTSPPYLNAQTYAKDNWLRLWLLGYDYKQIHNEYIETGSIKLYLQRMQDVFAQMFRLLKPDALLICVAGDVKLPVKSANSKAEVFKTGYALASLCGSPQIGLRIEEHARHVVRNSSRYLHALSKSNGHQRKALIERVFVARKPKENS